MSVWSASYNEEKAVEIIRKEPYDIWLRTMNARLD